VFQGKPTKIFKKPSFLPKFYEDPADFPLANLYLQGLMVFWNAMFPTIPLKKTASTSAWMNVIGYFPWQAISSAFSSSIPMVAG